MFSLGFTVDDVKRVLWTALQAFIGTFLVLAPGIAAAPNMSEAKAAGVAAVTAAFAAAISALKNGLLAPTSSIR